MALHTENKGFKHSYKYIIILLKPVCRRSQSTGSSSCSIVSGDISNCSYRLSFSYTYASKFGLAIFYRQAQKPSVQLLAGSHLRPLVWPLRCIHRLRTIRRHVETLDFNEAYSQSVDIITGPTFTRKRLGRFTDNFPQIAQHY